MPDAKRKTSLEKSLAILEALLSDEHPVGVADMAKRKGEAVSSVARSLFTLEALGYVERQQDEAGYTPGISCLRPAYGYLRSSRLLEAATPFVIDLSDRFETRADLAVLDGTEMIYLARVPARDEIMNLSPLGRRWPAIFTASGRSILSILAEDDCEAVLAKSDHAQLTSASTTDTARLRELIDEARRKGYAYQYGEILPGTASIAAPITGGQGRVLGSILLGGAISSFQHEGQLSVMVQGVMAAASALSALKIE
jgi:DNA-binding IclR family transcriptional regulator